MYSHSQSPCEKRHQLLCLYPSFPYTVRLHHYYNPKLLAMPCVCSVRCFHDFEAIIWRPLIPPFMSAQACSICLASSFCPGCSSPVSLIIFGISQPSSLPWLCVHLRWIPPVPQLPLILSTKFHLWALFFHQVPDPCPLLAVRHLYLNCGQPSDGQLRFHDFLCIKHLLSILAVKRHTLGISS